MSEPALRTVLVATTLSPESDAVVATAAAWARAAGAKLHVLHAMLLPLEYDDLPGASWRSPDAYGLLESTLRRELDAQLARLSIPTEALAASEIVDGTPWRVIRGRAEDVAADLVVVGATDRGDLLDRLLGSTAAHVLAGAPQPVLVVRGQTAALPARVLAPVDLSPLSGQAFDDGCALLGAVAGAAPPQLRALFVLEPRQRLGGTQFSPEQMDRFAAEELGRFAAAHGAAARQAGLAIDTAVTAGEPRDAVPAAAAAWPADLVLIGTHGYTGWDRRVFGSVASEVMQRSPCSVLVVRPR